MIKWMQECWTEFNTKKVYRLMFGHIYFQTLAAAVELDLFTLLDKNPGLTKADIASMLKIEEKPARILLLGLASLGLVRRKGERYYNTRMSKRYFSRSSVKNAIDVVRWENHIVYQPMYHFEEAIRANTNVGLKVFKGQEKTLYERLFHYPDLLKIFQNAMQSLSSQANHALPDIVDFSQFKFLIDVGGGNGTNLMAIANKHADLKAAVFDFPDVCEIARKNIKSKGFDSRLGAIAGDSLKDPFPTGVDCILFCHFFTIWSEQTDKWFLKKSYDALPAGGAVIVYNMMQDDDEKGPLVASAGSPYFLTLATGEGMLYTAKEYETWMREAGFSRVERRSSPTQNHTAIIGYK